MNTYANIVNTLRIVMTPVQERRVFLPFLNSGDSLYLSKANEQELHELCHPIPAGLTADTGGFLII